MFFSNLSYICEVLICFPSVGPSDRQKIFGDLGSLRNRLGFNFFVPWRYSYKLFLHKTAFWS